MEADDAQYCEIWEQITDLRELIEKLNVKVSVLWKAVELIELNRKD